MEGKAEFIKQIEGSEPLTSLYTAWQTHNKKDQTELMWNAATSKPLLQSFNLNNSNHFRNSSHHTLELELMLLIQLKPLEKALFMS